MQKIEKKEFDEIADSAIETFISKSIRRILFITKDDEKMKEGKFFVSCMSGKGTVIIIKYKYRFFAITAKHVLKDTKNKNGQYFNESPFWFPTQFAKSWASLHDFFMPKKLWNIGELIKIDDFTKLDDIVMIELYYPLKDSFPNYYIDYDTNKDIFLKKENFFNGKVIMVSGYPFVENSFDWDIHHSDPEITHATPIHRRSIPGVFLENDGVGYISFECVENGITHDETNGMSGGIIYDLQPDPIDTRICGMLITVGSNKGTFIPSYIIKKAIDNFESSSEEIIDPMELTVCKPKTTEDIKKYESLLKILCTPPS